MADLATRSQIVNALMASCQYSKRSASKIADILVEARLATERQPGYYWVKLFSGQDKPELMKWDGRGWSTWGQPDAGIVGGPPPYVRGPVLPPESGAMRGHMEPANG